MAHPNLDKLLDFCIRFAQEQLQKRGAFHPFGATVSPNGDINPVAIQPGDETTGSEGLIDQYRQVFRTLAKNDDVEGCAVCYDSRVSVTGEEKDKKDSIAVALEHSNHECVTVFLPYWKNFFRRYRYGRLVAVAGERQIFD